MSGSEARAAAPAGGAPRGAARRTRPGGNLAKDHSVGRTLAALVGTPAAALAASVGLVRALPLDEGVAFAIGFYGFTPIWVALVVFAFLARSGPRAWALVAAVAFVGGALAAVG